MKILITGGAGYLGSTLAEHLLFKGHRVTVLDNLMYKQTSLLHLFKQPKFHFIAGDVRDKDRLKLALNGIDIVVHAAALKQVPAAEYNPIEFIKTNIIGAKNIVEVALELSVTNVIALSTDKASSPINLYGATKLCSDKLFISANNIKGNKNIKFSVVRYGNVMGSRGSVLKTFLDQKKNGIINKINIVNK
jgi:FlaA1/EpsC-like NDP-sugar epimerase